MSENTSNTTTVKPHFKLWAKKVEALTVADVRNAMARKLQPERMVTVVVGGKP